MAIRTVTDAIRYVGVDDNTLALFENQYPVQPMGVSYNSYVILDEKIAVMDSVDARAAEEWLSNVARVLEGRSPDYLVVTHMEPDHSGSLMRLAQKYPEMKIVGNAKTFTLIKQFFGTGAGGAAHIAVVQPPSGTSHQGQGNGAQNARQLTVLLL